MADERWTFSVGRKCEGKRWKLLVPDGFDTLQAAESFARQIIRADGLPPAGPLEQDGDRWTLRTGDCLFHIQRIPPASA